jgi:pimeloyl-ACP methyl ester carboxylesterase
MSTSGIAESRHHDIRTADGRVLRVHETGDPQGELVLVHHGTPGWGLLPAAWEQDALDQGIRLVSYDRPGYGGSDRHSGRCVADVAADAAPIADGLGVGRFRTWGASGGGPHALACAALLPDRVVAAGVIASVAPYDAAGLDWLAGMGQDNIDEFGAALAGESTLSPFLVKVREQLMSVDAVGVITMLRSILPAVDVAVLTGEWGEFVYQSMTGGIAAGVDGWLDDDLTFCRPWGFDPAQISVPVRLWHGRADLMVPFAHGVWLAGHVPNVTAELLDEDGHLSTLARVPELHRWLLAQ